MSTFAVLKRWPIASWLFGLHALLVLLVYILWLASSRDMERDMIWLWMLFIDFPIFFAYIPLVDDASGLVTALVCLIIGGLQWAIVGVAVDLLRTRYVHRHSLRGTPNI